MTWLNQLRTRPRLIAAVTAGVAAATLLPALTLGGSAAGAWVGAMIGLNVDSSQVKEFAAAIEAGQILMLVDVPPERALEVEILVRESFPTATLAWGDPSLPPVS